MIPEGFRQTVHQALGEDDVELLKQVLPGLSEELLSSTLYLAIADFAEHCVAHLLSLGVDPDYGVKTSPGPYSWSGVDVWWATVLRPRAARVRYSTPEEFEARGTRILEGILDAGSRLFAEDSVKSVTTVILRRYWDPFIRESWQTYLDYAPDTVVPLPPRIMYLMKGWKLGFRYPGVHE